MESRQSRSDQGKTGQFQIRYFVTASYPATNPARSSQVQPQYDRIRIQYNTIDTIGTNEYHRAQAGTAKQDKIQYSTSPSTSLLHVHQLTTAQHHHPYPELRRFLPAVALGLGLHRIALRPPTAHHPDPTGNCARASIDSN